MDTQGDAGSSQGDGQAEDERGDGGGVGAQCHAEAGRPTVRPTGLAPGQKRRVMVWLTTPTAGAVAPSAGGPQRRADGNFPVGGGAAGKQEVSGVGAGDPEKNGHGGAEDEEGRFQFGGELFGEGQDDH